MNQLGTAAKGQNFRPNNIKLALIIPRHNTRPLKWPRFFGEGEKYYKNAMDLSKLFHIFSIVKHFTSESQFEMIQAKAFSIKPRCGYNICTPFVKTNFRLVFVVFVAKFSVLLA